VSCARPGTTMQGPPCIVRRQLLGRINTSTIYDAICDPTAVLECTARAKQSNVVETHAGLALRAPRPMQSLISRQGGASHSVKC
jgi:hypothetical protein